MASEYEISDGFLDQVYVLDRQFNTKKVLDTFSSLTWKISYNEVGSFALVFPVIESLIKDLEINDYLWVKEAEEYMILETMLLTTDSEEGDQIQIEGRSLTSILSRRIVWTKFSKPKDSNFQNGIAELITREAINPTDPERKIPGLAFRLNGDPAITGLTYTFDVEVGANLLDVILIACNELKVHFRINPKEDGIMECELRMGEDRSWSQTQNPVVVFSDSYENLVNSSYIQSEKEYISNALVKGDTNQAEIYRKNKRTGLDRREAYIEVSGDKDLDSLFQLAKDEMSKSSVTEMFGGEVEPFHQFVFGRDYFIGDIVQVQNRYGFEGRARITEIMMTRDAGGPLLTPSFAIVDKNNEEVDST